MKVSAAGIDRRHKPPCPADCVVHRVGRRFSRIHPWPRVLNDVIGLLADEIAVLDKAIAAGRQP